MDPDYEVVINKEIPQMREQSEIQATSAQRPDGVSFNETARKIGLVYDVQSSSNMTPTAKKAVLGAANLIRLLRNEEVNLNQITVFALPSENRMSCIIEIVVKRHQLQLIFCFNDVHEGLERIKDVFTKNIDLLPRLPRSVQNYYVRLTKDEITLLLSDGEQLYSRRHIIVHSPTTVAKVITI